MRYSVETNDKKTKRIYVKGYGIFFAKKLSNKYSQKLLDSGKKSKKVKRINSKNCPSNW